MTIRAQYTTTTPAFALTTTPDGGTALPTTDPNAYGSRPLAALLQANGGSLRWTDDGTTPTASVGMLLSAGSSMVYQRDLNKLKFIQVASGAILDVTYYDRQEGNIPVMTQGSAELVNDVGSAINVSIADGADVTLGAKADSSATTDGGTFTLMALVKRVLAKMTLQLPAGLGQATMAASLPVTVASNQSAVLGDVSGSQFATVLTGVTMTRPADTNAYAVGDLVANSTTAASVVAIAVAAATTSSGGVGEIQRIRLKSSSTSLTNAQYRVHFYNTLPGTPANGDNGAFSTSLANYIGAFDVTIDRAGTDGSVGLGVPLTGSTMLYKCAALTLYALIEARAARTPASEEVFTLICETKRW